MTDGQWIITFGHHGLVGLNSVMGILLVAATVLIRRLTPSALTTPAYAPAAACVMTVLLYAYDNLTNPMMNPVFVLTVGGLSGFAIRTRRPAQSLATSLYRSSWVAPAQLSHDQRR